MVFLFKFLKRYIKCKKEKSYFIKCRNFLEKWGLLSLSKSAIYKVLHDMRSTLAGAESRPYLIAERCIVVSNYFKSTPFTFCSPILNKIAIILSTRNKIPPNTIYSVPICDMKKPHMTAPMLVPRFVATKNNPLAKSGTCGAAEVIQY